MKSKFTLILTIIALIFNACSDHNDHNKNDVTPPTVTITSPVNEITLNNTQTISIIGSIKDDLGLHQAEIKISKGATTLSSYEPDVFNMTDYQINQNLSIAGIKSGDVLTLRVEAIDHNDNIGLIEKDITVK